MAETFGAWLKAQVNRNDPVGDLARDFVQSPGSGASSVNGIRRDLERHNAIPAAHDALDEAAREWGGNN